MKNEKLLVIGAGIGQVPIINKAKAKGISVTVVTKPGNFSGIDIADEVFECDIYDRDAIVKYAKQNGITAVISDQNDLMNPTVAYVAEKLGLPGNRFDQVMAYCNKNTFRDNCDRLGIPVPKHIAVESEAFDYTTFDCPFPWIVKPADSQSSIGVQRVDTPEEFYEALRFALSVSRTHSAIVEEFFFGKEIVCEGFIENGQYHLLSFADRKYFNLPNLMIPTQTVFPSVLDETLLAEVIRYEEKMAAYVDPAFGIVHSEYLVNDEKREIRIVESALRGGGVYISSHLIPFATGIDINEILLKKALGRPCDVSATFDNKQQKAAGYVCFYLPEGTVKSVSGVQQIKDYPFVRMVCVDDIKAGDKTEKMLHKGLRKGPILVTGDDRADLEKNIATVQQTLKIEVVAPDGRVNGICWE